jgi:hypothetical protein
VTRIIKRPRKRREIRRLDNFLNFGFAEVPVLEMSPKPPLEHLRPKISTGKSFPPDDEKEGAQAVEYEEG